MRTAESKRATVVVLALALAAGLGGSPRPDGHGPVAQAERLRPAAVTDSVQYRWPKLTVGSAGADAVAAKRLLRSRGYPVSTDSTFWAGTAAKVRDFQADRGLPVTGRVGEPTWRALFVTVRSGSAGDAVRAAQRELAKNGYPVPVTGAFDAATDAAVRRLQADRGLTADGVVGPATWTSLVRGHLPAKVVRKGTTTRKIVALTFDAGSDAGNTARILDLLADEGIRATFGLTGEWVLAHPDLARRIVAAGHQVVNHTYDHASFTGYSTGKDPLTFAQRRAEVERAWAVMSRQAGARFSAWFRPPYGDRDASVDRDVAAVGYPRELMWTVDSLGWQGRSPDEVARRVLDAATPGEIVLMHVGSASTDADALPRIVAGLRDRGYGFTTASGVMR